MTSRKLTSGCVFGQVDTSVWPLCSVISDLVQNTFIHIAEILAFYEIQDGLRPPSWICWWSRGPPRKVHLWWIPL